MYLSLYLPVYVAIFRNSKSVQEPGSCAQIPPEITDLFKQDNWGSLLLKMRRDRLWPANRNHECYFNPCTHFSFSDGLSKATVTLIIALSVNSQARITHLQMSKSRKVCSTSVLTRCLHLRLRECRRHARHVNSIYEEIQILKLSHLSGQCCRKITFHLDFLS